MDTLQFYVIQTGLFSETIKKFSISGPIVLGLPGLEWFRVGTKLY